MDATLFLCLGAAFFAGVLNAIAGGGTFLTLPALILAGVPPVAANATSTLVVLPGYLGSVFGYLQRLIVFDRKQLAKLAVASALGGGIGAWILLGTSNDAFLNIVPWLLLLATVLFATGKSLSRFLKSKKSLGLGLLIPSAFVASIYGGYFNGGVGIVLLALLLVAGIHNLHGLNALKNLISLILSAISSAMFFSSGLIALHLALPMMVCAVVGGYAGAKLATRLPDGLIRWMVVGIGVFTTVMFFIRAANV